MLNQSIINAIMAVKVITLPEGATYTDATTKPMPQVKATLKQLCQDREDCKRLMDAAIAAYEGAVYAERQIANAYMGRTHHKEGSNRMKPPTREELKDLLSKVIAIRNQMEDAGEDRGEDYGYIKGLYDALQWVVNAESPPDISAYEEEG